MTRFDDGYETAIHFPGSTGPPVSLRSTVEAFEQTLLELDPAVLRPIPTGFPHLDANMGGGLHGEDLVLVVGKQNVGKTLFVSQLGRNIARWASQQRNRVVSLLICYEHSPLLLLQRLLCMESWLAGGSEGGVSLAWIRDSLADLAEKSALEDVSSLLLKLPKTGLLGWRGMERYLDTLYLCRGDPVYVAGGDRQDGGGATAPGTPSSGHRRLRLVDSTSTRAYRFGERAAYRLCGPLFQGAGPSEGRAGRGGRGSG